MKFLLYGINFAPELTGIGKYSGEMARWLAASGHDVRVVAAPPYYPEWKVDSAYSNAWSNEFFDGVRVYRCPLYVPSVPVTSTRVLHLLSFALSSLVALSRLLLWRPHVVFVVQPTLFCLPAAWVYARLSGARLVLHVQDYELNAMFGLGFVRGGCSYLERAAYAVERWWMRRVDVLSTISASMMKLAEIKGVIREKIVFFPNWVDTSVIRPGLDRYYYRRQWGIPGDTRVILYSGNMGAKQGLELVIDAAAQWRTRTDVLFVMVGHGAALAGLQAVVAERHLTNVLFYPLQPYEQLPLLLAMADVHLVVQKSGAADIVLPSKLTGILSAGGHALITAEADTELGLLCAQYPGIAERVEPDSLPDFLAGLQRLLNVDTSCSNTVARAYAEQYLNGDAVLARFVENVGGDIPV